MINYEPKLRVTPLAGPQINYALSAVTLMTRAAVFYDRLFLEREFLNRSVRHIPLGYRVRAEFEFAIPQAPHADQSTLSEIMGHFADPEASAELSMGDDEFGVDLYRAVGTFEESMEYVEGVLSILRYSWTMQMRDLIAAPVAPGLAATARW